MLDKPRIHMNPEKVRAIIDAPEPSTVTESQSFLGCVNCYSKFFPDMSGTASPLYELLHKNAKWRWVLKHQ